jgi:hypothetical protein
VKKRVFRGILLSTSSALALLAAVDQSATAATCTVVADPALPYSQAGNTCVSFSVSPVTSGSVTNGGTVTATGSNFAQDRAAITVFIGVSLNGTRIPEFQLTYRSPCHLGHEGHRRGIGRLTSMWALGHRS